LARLIDRSLDDRALLSPTRKRYAIEKFYLAALSLVSGIDEINERLFSAAIALSVLSARDFPDDLQEHYSALWENLTSEEVQIEGEGRIRATIRKMKPEDATTASEQIFDLYFRLLDITPFGNRRE
jgi:hypothetical protein